MSFLKKLSLAGVKGDSTPLASPRGFSNDDPAPLSASSEPKTDAAPAGATEPKLTRGDRLRRASSLTVDGIGDAGQLASKVLSLRVDKFYNAMNDKLLNLEEEAK